MKHFMTSLLFSTFVSSFALAINDPNCGTRAPTVKRTSLGIINGNDSHPLEFPWQVSLNYEGENRVCGGSVLNKRWIVTAGHCAFEKQAENITVVLGAWNISNVHEDTRIEVNVEKAIVHPKFNDNDGDYDIALLKLTKVLDLENPNRAIGSICLPEANGEIDALAGTVCTTSGWGADYILYFFFHFPDILLKANLTVLKQSYCIEQLKKFPGTFPVTPRMICASNDEQSSCHGDGGGPLACYKKGDGRWYLNGVASWSNPDCDDQNLFPSVFTRVTELVPWIKETIEQN